jgi:membrane-associated phospholipid phosphatase
MDASLYRDINRFAVDTAWAHGFMKAYAVDGVGLFALLVLGSLWFARRRPGAPEAVAASMWAAAGTVLALGVNQPIVAAVHRARPYTTLAGVEVLVHRSHDFSFPSDHATAAGAATAGLWIIALYGGAAARRLAIVGTALAVLVAFSRVYVGAHYPGDVVGGLVVGAAVTTVGWIVLERPVVFAASGLAKHRHLAWLVRARPVVPGSAPSTAREPAVDPRSRASQPN